jgi:hypothetical protein
MIETISEPSMLIRILKYYNRNFKLYGQNETAAYFIGVFLFLEYC